MKLQISRKGRCLDDVTLKKFCLTLKHISKTCKARGFKFGIQFYLCNSQKIGK